MVLSSPMRKLLVLWLALPAAIGAAGKTTVLKAAHLFDGKSDHVISPGLVVVTDGKIVAVGPSSPIPAGAETIDLGDATLLPGFMDAHTHLSDPYTLDYRQEELDLLKKTVAERALDASETVRKTLMAGFTTVRDLGSEDYIDVGLRRHFRGRGPLGHRGHYRNARSGETGGYCRLPRQSRAEHSPGGEGVLRDERRNHLPQVGTRRWQIW